MTSAEIDRTVSDLVSRGERIYEIDLDALKIAKPDLVITQELCEVCAVSFEDVQEAVIQLDMPPRVVSLDPHSLGDVLQNIQQIGEYTGETGRASEYIRRLDERIENVKSRISSTDSRPTVACIEWLDPMITAGHWVPEMVEIAGGTDVLAEPGGPSLRIEFQVLADASPDILVLMPCGMGIEAAQSEFNGLKDAAQWRELSAFKNEQVYVVDSGALYSRSGPRLVDGLEIFGQMFHPEKFSEKPKSDLVRPLTL
jgi:iron complex transport system substrate-binding protein